MEKIYLLMKTSVVPHAADGHVIMITVFPRRVGHLIPVYRCSLKAQSRQMTHNVNPLEHPHLQKDVYIRFEVLRAVTMKNTVSWHVMLCSLMGKYVLCP
jgi:hypothetical protein